MYVRYMFLSLHTILSVCVSTYISVVVMEIFYLKCKNLLNVITVINLSLKTKLLFS